MKPFSAQDHTADIVLAAGIRTPWAKAGVAFREEDAAHLGALAARELLARSGLANTDLDEVIAGCVGPPHDQANLGRVLGLRAGIAQGTPARTVARNCASGFETVTSAMDTLLAGRGDTFLCVGVEMMSAYPLLFGNKMVGLFENLMKARTLGARIQAMAKFRPAFLKPRVALLEGLRDPITGLLMGSTAEHIARDFGITRQACDQYALQSHQRACAAKKSGRLEKEIFSVLPLDRSNKKNSLIQDDSPREEQTLERLAKLRPYFEKPDGVVTVGNACGITDGAAALLITTAERASALGLSPLAKIRSFAWTGCDPSRMGLGPVSSTHAALQAASCSLEDIGAIELNEAFAAQVLGCVHGMKKEGIGELRPERLNVNGGAIAFGHPVGATGARLLLTAAHELKEGNHELTLATLCIGGGQGGAFVLENIT
jgi:acetyl-CoA acetyltransferase family protein